MKKNNVGHWNSIQGEKEYKKAYEETLNKFPPNESTKIETSFGNVQMHCWNKLPKNQHKPVVFLPGKASGSPMWINNISDFAKDRTVYAFDSLGDAGLSIQTKKIANLYENAKWIDEVFSELNLKKVNLIGHSFGGFLSANYAIQYPKRIATLSLIEPVFVFQYIKISLFLWSIPYSIKFLPKKWRDNFIKKIGNMTEIDYNDSMSKMIACGSDFFISKLPFPKLISKIQLQQWNFPVFVAMAENSAIHNSIKGIKVAEDNIKNIEAIFWKNATHSLPMEYTAELDERIIRFINEKNS